MGKMLRSISSKSLGILDFLVHLFFFFLSRWLSFQNEQFFRCILFVCIFFIFRQFQFFNCTDIFFLRLFSLAALP